MQSCEHLFSITSKTGSRQAPNILQHYSCRFTFFYNAERSRKKITFVIRTELFTGYRKRGTGNTARKQIYAFIFFCVEMMNIAFDDIPFLMI